MQQYSRRIKSTMKSQYPCIFPFNFTNFLIARTRYENSYSTQQNSNNKKAVLNSIFDLKTLSDLQNYTQFPETESMQLKLRKSISKFYVARKSCNPVFNLAHPYNLQTERKRSVQINKSINELPSTALKLHSDNSFIRIAPKFIITRTNSKMRSYFLDNSLKITGYKMLKIAKKE